VSVPATTHSNNINITWISNDAPPHSMHANDDAPPPHATTLFTTYNETKASIVERCNRTLKTKMWKYFTANNTLKYVDIFSRNLSVIKSYNHSRHRSICMRPVDVNKNNQNIVWQTLYGKESKKSIQFKFSIGDQVRMKALSHYCVWEKRMRSVWKLKK
jgi:hypothetical protein